MCDRKLDTKGACLCGVNPGKKNDQKYTRPLLEKNDQSKPTMLWACMQTSKLHLCVVAYHMTMWGEN